MCYFGSTSYTMKKDHSLLLCLRARGSAPTFLAPPPPSWLRPHLPGFHMAFPSASLALCQLPPPSVLFVLSSQVFSCSAAEGPDSGTAHLPLLHTHTHTDTSCYTHTHRHTHICYTNIHSHLLLHTSCYTHTHFSPADQTLPSPALSVSLLHPTITTQQASSVWEQW